MFERCAILQRLGASKQKMMSKSARPLWRFSSLTWAPGRRPSRSEVRRQLGAEGQIQRSEVTAGDQRSALQLELRGYSKVKARSQQSEPGIRGWQKLSEASGHRRSYLEVRSAHSQRREWSEVTADRGPRTHHAGHNDNVTPLGQCVVRVRIVRRASLPR